MTPARFANFHSSRLVITATIVVLVVFAIIFFLVIPQMRAVSLMRNNIDVNEKQIVAIQDKIKSYQEAHDTFKQMTGSVEVPQIFPAREDMVSLVEGIEKAVALSGGLHTLSLVDTEGQKQPAGKKGEAEGAVKGLSTIKEIPYSIQYSGNFIQAIDFLSYLENLPFVTIVNVVSLSADSNKSEGSEIAKNNGFATMQIDGYLFVKK